MVELDRKIDDLESTLSNVDKQVTAGRVTIKNLESERDQQEEQLSQARIQPIPPQPTCTLYKNGLKLSQRDPNQDNKWIWHWVFCQSSPNNKFIKQERQ